MNYTDEQKEYIFNDIEEEIIGGRAIRNILLDKGMPSASNFFAWLKKNPEWQKRYACACKMRADLLFESIEHDFLEEPEYTNTAHGSKIDSAWVQLQTMKINAKKWMIAKMAPEVYGDKIDVTSDNKPIEQAQPVWNFINANKEQK